MAAGDLPIVAGQTKSAYRTLNSKLIGEAFDARLSVSASNSNILAHLQGGPGSGKPFVIKTDLAKGAMETVNIPVGTSLGQSGRRGTQQAINFEEPLFHGSWGVTIDSLRVVVGWNEITAAVATTGMSWRTIYADLCGKRLGQIEQEDMLMRLRTRATTKNTIRPGNKTTLNALRYDDVIDSDALGRAIRLASTRGAKPAMVGTSRAGMPINKFVALGSETALTQLWNDPTFAAALQYAEVRGEDNPFWTGDIPNWKGTAIKQWYVVDHDNPGPIGSSIEARAVLGDCSASGGTTPTGLPTTAATGTMRLWGGGRTQASLGNAAAIYTPFCYFYGNDYLFGETLSVGADATEYYVVIVDPADGKWCVYAYSGSTGIGLNGNYLNVSKRFGPATAGSAFINLGALTGDAALNSVVWDTNVNKEVFPIGSFIYQINNRVVPVGDMFILGAECAGKAYGKIKNQPIQQNDDYDALVGKGIHSIYGSDCAKDTQGDFRGYVRVQTALQIEGLGLLPKLS